MQPTNRRRVLGASGALLAAALLGGCLGGAEGPDDGAGDDDADDGNGTGDGTDGPDGDENAVEALARSNAEFALALHRRLVEADPGENLLASPYSVSVALAMTYAGARGETAEQMREALRFSLDDEALHPAFGDLGARLDSLGGEADSESDDEGEEATPFALNLANSVWGQADYPWYDDYLDLLEAHYGAGMNVVDYASDPEGAREEINEWVAERTEDRIDELLPAGSLDELARLVLTNAVYFKANWERPFPEHRTEGRPFVSIDGATADVPTMSVDDRFPYVEVDGHRMVELPYEGGEASMLAILPAEGEFESFEESLDADWLADASADLEPADGTVTLPKFEFESGFALQAALSDLGMPIAFEYPDADFGGMADLERTGEDLFLWDVYHDTFIAVDEAGTEAAAATGVVVGTESAPADPFEFVADRPFLFAIRDRKTGTVLFLGRVVDAAAAAPEA